MDIRIDGLDVFVDGKRVENPAQRIAIAIPAVVLGITFAAVAVFVLLPLLGLGLLAFLGVVLMIVFSIIGWVLLPVIVPLLVGLGLAKLFTRNRGDE
ncbi:MAG: hypothetical protein AAF525_02710 [Pseudomonadota bacterium]